MSLSEKAKTGREICDSIMEFYKGLGMARLVGKRWISLEEFKRRELEEWVRLEDAKQEIDDCKASWQNLKDTIPKFDAKISFLETRLKACNRLIDEMQRERGLQKQKLQQFEEFLVAWIENDVGKKKTHYYPSQDLDLILDFFFELRELLK